METTSFAALIAAMGIVIGAAWVGLLSSFATGVFLVALSPFKVGDFVTILGVTSIIQYIGLFTSTINTPDNILIHIGKNKIFSDNTPPTLTVAWKDQRNWRTASTPTRQIYRRWLSGSQTTFVDPSTMQLKSRNSPVLNLRRG